MDVVISLKTPLCVVCNMTVKNMEMLNMHMENAHQESDHERMTRVTDTVKAALHQESIKMNNIQNIKSLDCTECGMVFQTIEEQHSHNQKVHASGLVTNIKIQKSNHKLLVQGKTRFSVIIVVKPILDLRRYVST